MIMVMLSQPTPPVSEFEARQLSIMFSQIFSNSWCAAIPRLTNSTTACDDWQSQIPREKKLVEAQMKESTSAREELKKANRKIIEQKEQAHKVAVDLARQINF